MCFFQHKEGDMSTFTLQLIQGRWFMVFASLLIMAMAGMNYLFSLYSNDIKSSMGYDQATLNLVSFSKDVGGFVGILPSLISQVMPPWVLIFIGAVMNFFGYFMMWLSVTGHLKRVALWQMCLFICIGCNSQTFINTGTVITWLRNFPKSRGIAMGLLMGYVGLSGAILTQLYHAFKSHKFNTIILLFAWLPSTIYICFLRAIRIKKEVELQKDELKVFYHILYVSFFLAGYLMVIIILQNMINFTKAGYYASASIVVLLLCLPLVVAIKQEYSSKKNSNHLIMKELELDIHINSKKPPSQVLNEDPNNHNKSSCMTNILKKPDRGEDYTILQAIFSLDMFLLFVASVCGLGGSLTAIDNMGQIGVSLGYPTRTLTTFVSLVSIWNYLGRVFSGFVSDYVLIRYKFPRPMLMTIFILFSCVGYLLIAFAVPHSLYEASVIIGFSFGAQCPLANTIASDLFGLRYYAWIFNFVTMAVPAGTYIFNAMCTGKLYDRVALRQLHAKGLTRKAGEDLNCFGAECYKLSFIVIIGFSLFGCLISSILVIRTWKFYRGDIQKKFRHNVEVDSNEKVITTG